MLEENIQYLIEKVDLLTKLVYELKNMTTPNEQSSVSNQHVLTDIQGAIRITGKAKPTIYANARKGIIPSYKRGNKLYFYEDELYKWIEGGKQDCYGINSEEMLNEIRQQIRHLPSSNRESLTYD
jgi:hypothetical protein